MPEMKIDYTASGKKHTSHNYHKVCTYATIPVIWILTIHLYNNLIKQMHLL